MNKHNIQDIKQHLLDLASNKEVTKYSVCAELNIKFNYIVEVDNSLYPNCSGDKTFPVKPGKNSFTSFPEIRAFYNLPKWEGEYGENRRDYCRWLANNLQGYFTKYNEYGYDNGH